MNVPEVLRLRLEAERKLLNEVHPTAQIVIDSLVVVLADYALPVGWSHETTDVLFAIPENYPIGQPDNICARPDISLAGGLPPSNSQGIQIHDGRPWLQFSFHVEPGDWRPRND